MPDAVRGKDTLGYLGTPAVSPSNVIVEERNPTNLDDKQSIGTLWVNPSSDQAFMLTAVLPDTRSKWVEVT